MHTSTITQQHPFHLVTPSPWPLLTSFSLLAIMLNTVIYFHSIGDSLPKVICAFGCLVFCIIRWFTDITNEATFEGNHTKRVQQGIRQGMLLFIVSEVFFFFSFSYSCRLNILYWYSFFHFSFFQIS